VDPREQPKARVLILTDRDELDKQIKRVFEDGGEQIHRTSSGRDLMEQLGQAKPRLLCSLIHKFGRGAWTISTPSSRS
jgi:type I restriction enzyme, R subunit